MKTKKNGIKRKSRLIGKLKGKKRSKIMRGGSGSIISQTFINRITRKKNTLEIYENIDTAIGIKLLKQPHDIFFTITPMVLSVDIMQLAVNTKNIVISNSRYGKESFMSFKNLPSLIVDTTSYGSYGYTPTSRTVAKWCLIEETGLESNKFIRPPSKYLGINASISKLQGEVTNEQVFLAPMIDFNDEHLCLYRTNVTYKQNENDGLGEKRELYERIVYLRDIAEWLENIEINKKPELNINKQCDLYGLDDNYIIINKFRNTDDKDPYKDEYVICGYPNQETKQLILQFWQGIWKEQFNLTHTDNLELYIKLFNQKNTDKINDKTTDLYKFYSSMRKDIFDYVKARYKKIDISKSATFETDFNNNVKIYFNEIANKYLYKFMLYIKYNFFIFKKHPIIGGTYKLVPAVFNIRELTLIHKPILERINKLIRNELPRRFGISSEGDYNPIEKYDIKAEYNEDKEYKLFYSHYRHGQVFHIKTEYLHSMSNISDKYHSYKYGLTLEEIIYNCDILSDIDNKPYFETVKFIYEVREHQIDKYDSIASENKNSKTQENKSLNNSVSSISKKIEPNRADKVYELYEEEKLIKQYYNEKSKVNTDIPPYELWRSTFNSIIDFEYNKWKELNSILIPKIKEYELIPFQKDKIPNIKFILMFVSSSQEYVFIYVLDSIFYKLVIKSNISNMTKIILKKLNKKINENHNEEFIDKTISFEKEDLPQVFRIISNTKLDSKDQYFKASIQPIILKHFSKPVEDVNHYIDTFYYYSTDLLNVIKHKPIGYIETFIPNLYNNELHKIILLDNFYINNKNFDKNKIKYDDKKFPDCITQSCITNVNYIFKNIETNCGYDFIEVIDDEQQKLTVYVYPSYLHDEYTTIRTKYLGNFMDLEYTSISMLEKIEQFYCNNNNICFVHQTLTPYYNCLHFHITKKDLYKREYSKLDKGSFLLQDIYISELINNLKINKNYYRDYNYSLIKSS